MNMIRYNKQEIIASGRYPNYDVSLSLDTTDQKISFLSKFLKDLDSFVCTKIATDNKILQVMGIKTYNKKAQREKPF